MNQAFRREFETLSSSIYRVINTQLRGVRTLAPLALQDDWMARRRDDLVKKTRGARLLFKAMRFHAVNERERERVDALAAEFEVKFGPVSVLERLGQYLALAFSMVYSVRVRLFGETMQPRTLVTRYRWS